MSEAALDLRYTGQEYSLTIAVPTQDDEIAGTSEDVAARFEAEYQKIFGHRMDEPIEVVAVRATARTPLAHHSAAGPAGADDGSQPATLQGFSFSRGTVLEFTAVDRDSLAVGRVVAGPALIREDTSMTYLDAGYTAEVHPTGCLMIAPAGSEATGG